MSSCCKPKQHFVAIILCVMKVKSNIGFYALLTPVCLLSITMYCSGFLQIESHLNMMLQMNYLQKDNLAHLLQTTL